MARGMNWTRVAADDQMQRWGSEALGGDARDPRPDRSGAAFFSRYDGTCRQCGKPYRKGERIRRRRCGGYKHACCPAKVAAWKAKRRGEKKPQRSALKPGVAEVLAEVEQRHRPEEWHPRP